MDAEFIENLPKIRKMFDEVRDCMLGVERLKPMETVANNSRQRIIVDVDFTGAARMLGIPPNDEEVNLYGRVLSGAPFIIKALLAYSAELEQELERSKERIDELESEVEAKIRQINNLARQYNHPFI